MFRRNHKATPPASNVFLFEYLTNTLDEMLPVRSSKPNEQNAVVRSGSELPQVGEAEILRY
jgi:hypothetical protein